MAVRATGQFTIVDFTDALSLTGFISANKPKTQIYNPDNDTYQPNWATSPFMVLTPSLFILGTSSDIIGSAQVQSIKWYDSEAPTTALTDGATYGIPSSGVKTLTIKKNVLAGDVGAKDYICEVIYRDPGTGLDLSCKMSISLSKIINGGGITNAVATTPNGNIFKNGNVTHLTAEADLWRGSTVDTTMISYQWYLRDSTVSTDQGAGVGWRKLTSTSNFGISGYTTRQITVPASAITNIGVFKVAIRDTDQTSGTYNQTFWETVTFVDQSDPIQVSIVSTGGDVFKNGVGSTTLTAKLFRAGEEIDTTSPYQFTYKWYKRDKNGNLATGWGGTTDYKTGKSITVGSSDVDTKATFVMEIE